jgi:hypothetical protein
MGVAVGFDALLVEWFLIFCRNILTFFFLMDQVNKDEECLPMPEFFTSPCG